MSVAVIIWIFYFLQTAFGINDNVGNLKIAGIFENIQLHETAFRYSNNVYNLEKDLKDATVSHIVDPNIRKDDPFTAYKATCNFLKQSIVGIFGPQSSLNLDTVQAITERKDIPHILTRWFNPLQMGMQSLNFFPNPDRLADGFLDIINELGWKSFTVLYTDAEHLFKVNDFIRKAKDDGIIVYLEDINGAEAGNYRPILRNAARSGQKNFVIDCPIQDLVTLLTQLQQVGLLTAEYNYFLTNLDAHTEDLSAFQHSDAVITGVSLIKANDDFVQKVSKEVCQYYNFTFKLECVKKELDIETALIIDSVSYFLQTLNELKITEGQYLDCYTEESWSQGLNIINALKTGTFDGITGPIEFDKDGFRKAFQLTIYQIRDDFYIKGTWNTTDGLSEDIELEFEEEVDEESEIANRDLKVIVTLTKPYVMLKESAFHLKGNDRFEGFAIDLIEEIAELEGFDYTFIVKENNRHGAFDPKTGKWNGMIGDIIEGKADMAISDLTITKDREGPVEFTNPFMTVGISILFRKPAEVPPGFFHFALPFSITFWQYLGVSYLLMVVSLFFLGRLSPSEWQVPNTCKESKKYLVNELTFMNSFWFVAAGLFRQPTNVKINSLATKILAGVWYIYCFILFAMYISYSFARTSIVEKEKLFENAAELLEYAENNGIEIGAVRGGATNAFFKYSKIPEYEKIGEYMNDHPEQMAESSAEGIERALQGNYAFFMESATIEYTTIRHCNLTSYGGLLDSKGFGIAVKKGSPLLGPLNRALIKLQSSGELLRLKKEWWEEKYADNSCSEDEIPLIEAKKPEDIRGLLYITFLGTALAIILSFFEFTIYAFRLSKRIKAPFGKTFGNEISKCFGKKHSVQPIPEEVALTKPENGNASNKENA